MNTLDNILRDCSQKGWDSYNAEPVRPQAVAAARELADRLPPKALVPTPEGGVCWEWDDDQGGTYYVEVTYLPPHTKEG